MAKFDQQAVLAHLQEKWTSRLCPACKSNSWNIQDSTYQLTEFNPEGMVIGGPVVPVLAVLCSNCGYMMMFNALSVGAVKR